MGGFTAQPYAPPTMYSPRNDRIIDLIMHQGDVAARNAAAQGAIWGNAVQQLGGIAADYVGQRQEQKAAQKREALFQETLDTWNPEKPMENYRRLASLFGPEDAAKIHQGIESIRVQEDDPSPELFAQRVGAIEALNRKNPGWLQKNWGTVAPVLAPGVKKFLGADLGPEFTPEYAEILGPLNEQFNPKKEGTFKVVPPQGSVFDESKGEVVYTAPAAPQAPKTEQATFGGKVQERSFDQATGKWSDWRPLGASEGALNRAAAATKAEHGATAISDAIVSDIGRLPNDWRDWNASYVTRDAFSVRNNEQASAIATANAVGKILPTKKQADQINAANSALADIHEAQRLMQDPDVRKAVGAYSGKMTEFLAKGWADPFGGEKKVPATVRRFRAALNKLSAEERHRLYGSALTDVESRYAEGFLPGMQQSGETIDAALLEFGADIERGMDAMWGKRAKAQTGASGGPSSTLPAATKAELDRLFGGGK